MDNPSVFDSQLAFLLRDRLAQLMGSHTDDVTAGSAINQFLAEAINVFGVEHEEEDLVFTHLVAYDEGEHFSFDRCTMTIHFLLRGTPSTLTVPVETSEGHLTVAHRYDDIFTLRTQDEAISLPAEDFEELKHGQNMDYRDDLTVTEGRSSYALCTQNALHGSPDIKRFILGDQTIDKDLAAITLLTAIGKKQELAIFLTDSVTLSDEAVAALMRYYIENYKMRFDDDRILEMADRRRESDTPLFALAPITWLDDLSRFKDAPSFWETYLKEMDDPAFSEYLEPVARRLIDDDAVPENIRAKLQKQLISPDRSPSRKVGHI